MKRCILVTGNQLDIESHFGAVDITQAENTKSKQ
jgi:hypothetical protein